MMSDMQYIIRHNVKKLEKDVNKSGVSFVMLKPTRDSDTTLSMLCAVSSYRNITHTDV